MNETAKKIAVSMYQNSYDKTGEEADFVQIMSDIKSDKWKDRVEQVRATTDEEKRSKLKQSLPAFTCSGIFSERKESGLISHSGRLAVDFDLKDNPALGTSLEAVKEALMADKYSEYVAVSVSGKGLFVVVKIDGLRHAESFTFLRRHYFANLGLVIDKSCKDVSRLRFVSYDPNLFYNPHAESVTVSDEPKETPKVYRNIHNNGNEKNKKTLDAIIASGKLIGDDSYGDWLKIGFALSNEFGESGRSFFHELSRRSGKYDANECDKKFDNCIRNSRGEVTFATLVKLAKDVGVEIHSERNGGGKVKGDTGKPTKFFNTTDIGNAERLVDKHGDIIRHCHLWGKWLIWNGKQWAVDDSGKILSLAKEVAKRIFLEAQGVADDDLKESIQKWSHKSEGEGRLNSMVSLARSELGIPIRPDDLDSNLFYLNCLNGTIDLQSGELLPHQQAHYNTKMIPVEYNPDAQCPKWIEFLEDIFNWNYDIINFARRAVGYSLTGKTSEQCLFLLHGSGENGKSTFITAIKTLFGDYAQNANFDTFLLKNKESVNNDIARMKGARFISAIETEGEKRLSETIVKQLTGQDTITARFLFAEFFEFMPQLKIWLACNHKPVIRGTDHAIWRRIKLIPFGVTIPPEKRDGNLDVKLRAELPGILAWAVQGCLDWQKNGLQTPDEVKAATNEYRSEMDVLQGFIDDCIERAVSPDIKLSAGQLYTAYKNWCEANGEHVLTNKVFGRRFAEKGFEKKLSSGNWWPGIRLKA